MSVILQPQVAFPIVRQIANHLDGTTYYVRAFVRNAAGTLIDTVNLASQGSQRYQSEWQVPADPTGRGVYISIVTSVFTDSGYTTKSENYGDEENTYLVFDRVLPAMRGGGGSSLDSRTIRRIFAEELDKRPHPEMPDMPAMPRMRWDEVLAAIRDAKPEQTDLSPVLARVEAAIKAVEAKDVTPATDIAPITEQLETALAELRSAIQQSNADRTRDFIALEANLIDALRAMIEETLTDVNVNVEPQVQGVSVAKKQAAEPAFDLNQYAL